MILYSSIGELLKKPLSVDKNGDIMGISQQAEKNYYQLKDETNFQDLEEFLNGLYYRKNTGEINKEAEAIQNKFAETQSKIMADILGNAITDGNIKAQQEQKKEIGNQSSISKSVYTAYLDMLNKILNNWSTEGYIGLKNLKNNMEIDQEVLYQKIFTTAEALTKTSALELRRFGKTGKDGSRKENKIFEQIRELEELGIYLTKLQYVQAKVGNAQEKLAVVAKELYKNFEQGHADQLLSPLKDYKALNEAKNINATGLDRVYDIELTSDIMDDEDYKRVNKSGQVAGYDFDGVKVSIGAIRGIQQKMDVEFDIPGYRENINDLRVSLKSWDGFSGHDLGTTTLLNALLRTAGVDSMLAFGLQLKFKDERKYNAMELHKWAKTVAVMDIAAGLGQKKGYADTLIIQDRKNQRFRIFNMRTVMEQALSDGGYFQLTGYDTNMVSHMNFTTRRRLGGQQWRGAIAGVLKAQQISIGTRSSNL